MQSPTIFQLFLYFLRLGVTAFGGPAMINDIRKLAVEKEQWIDKESFNHGLALCQTLPGAIAVNTASYVGLRVRGLPGMIAGFAGFIMPALVLLLSFSIIYLRTHRLPAVASLFNGLQVIVVAIILYALVSFGRSTLKTGREIVIALLGATALLLKANPFVVIAGAALVGAFFYPSQGTVPLPAQHDTAHSAKRPLILVCTFVIILGVLFLADRGLFDLAVVMAKIELFAFGGGYTALTLMYYEVVEARSWLDAEAFMDGVALGQVTPGPVLINATFIGYLLKGAAGAVVGGFAIFAPGLLLITTALPLFDKLRSSPFFLRALKGIISCFAGLLLFVAITFATKIPWDVKHAVLCISTFTALALKVDLLYVVVGGALISIVIF